MAISTEERRIVTVLFADMAGSTALGEQLDPEEMRGLLARYYTIARESIEQHGGTVEKFIGDAVMAVFGLPTAHGDDPDRAVAAAVTIRERIQEDEQLKDRLAIRFGVSTGEVVASRDQSAGDFLITAMPPTWRHGCSRPPSRGASSPASGLCEPPTTSSSVSSSTSRRGAN